MLEEPQSELSPERIAEIQSWAKADTERLLIGTEPTIHRPTVNIINVVHHEEQ